MATEEFSFPTAEFYPCGIDSPPLWRLSPAASPDIFIDRKYCSAPENDDYDDEEEEEEEDGEDGFADGKQRKSFSYVEKSNTKLFINGEDDDDGEKMDLLWEDFNEEIMPPPKSRISSEGCRVQAPMNLSKTNNAAAAAAAAAMFSPRRPPAAAGVLVFMKALRRLFLLHHNSRRSTSVKHRKWKTKNPIV